MKVHHFYHIYGPYIKYSRKKMKCTCCLGENLQSEGDGKVVWEYFGEEVSGVFKEEVEETLEGKEM